MTIPTAQEVVALAITAQTVRNGRYVPAKPLNYTKPFLSLWVRVKWAWEVFQCRAVPVRYEEDKGGKQCATK